MQIIPVSRDNIHIYNNLAQCYEAEFSVLTHKKPNASGIFELDTQLGGDITGYLLYIDNTPAGLAAIAQKRETSYEICEFYVLPCFRQNSIGMLFAHTLWNTYPGEWEVKQIAGADYATAFWRKTIARYNDTPFTEEHYDDPYWGIVTRQTFTIN